MKFRLCQQSGEQILLYPFHQKRRFRKKFVVFNYYQMRWQAAVMQLASLPYLQKYFPYLISDTCCTDGFQHRHQTATAQAFCSLHQPGKFLLCQFLAGIPEHLSLNFQGLNPAILPAQEDGKIIQNGQASFYRHQGSDLLFCASLRSFST